MFFMSISQSAIRGEPSEFWLMNVDSSQSFTDFRGASSEEIAATCVAARRVAGIGSWGSSLTRLPE